MASYVIGDIHGCLQGLEDLLNHIAYRENEDHLYFAGDLVNRGPHSLETLRFVKQLPHAKTVLGNHDLHALALYACVLPRDKHHNMHPLLDAPDVDEIMAWLRQQPLMLSDDATKMAVVHAGLHPTWSVAQALSYAAEVETRLQASDWRSFISCLYGNEPHRFSPDLTGNDRLRCITNIFTRMRFLHEDGRLDFDHIGPVGEQPDFLKPWYTLDHVRGKDWRVYFGHWAWLGGRIHHNGALSTDGGYVWGGNLIARRIEDDARFEIEAPARQPR